MLLSVFIFFRPFPYTTSIINVSFYLAIGIALFLMFFKPSAFTFKTPLTYPLIAFFLWSLLSIFWALNVENTINDVRSHLLNHIILFFLLINFFRSRKRLAFLAWIIVLSATFFSLIGMIYYYVIMGNPLQSVRLGFIAANVGNVSTELPVNFIGALSMTAFFFCFYFFFESSSSGRRLLIIICALTSFAAMLLTQSRGTLVALFFAGGILLLIKNRKLLPVFIVALIILVFLTPFKDRLDKDTIIERLKINYVTYEVLKDHPVKGIGFGMMTFEKSINKEDYINKLPPENRPKEIYSPHNLLLDIAVRLGVIGLILFSAVLFVFGKICWKIIQHAKDEAIKRWGLYVAIAFLAYFILGMAEPLFLFKASAMIFYILLGMIAILSRLNDEAQAVEVQSTDHLKP